MRRLRRTQPIEIMYVERRARRVSETIILNANVEPRLTRQRIPAAMEVRQTALSGTLRL